MSDFRHQRQGRQWLQAHAGFTGIDHRQTHLRRLTRRLTARRHQQPVGIQPGGDEILAAGQAQVVQAYLHVGRTHATSLTGAQGAKACRGTGPEHAQGGLIPHQKGQPRGRHGSRAEHGQLERADGVQTRQ
ncbi:hypothetical protein D3C72_1751260 [compost metagenome]